jgi:hypothetical protein
MDRIKELVMKKLHGILDLGLCLGCGAGLVREARGQGLRWTVHGESTLNQLGYTIAAAGDVDGNGGDDVLLGIWRFDCNGPVTGKAVALRGTDGAEVQAVCGTATSAFAYAVAGLLDLDQDGHDDLIVGNFGDDRNGAIAGACTIYSGANGAVLRDHLGAADDGFGWAVASVRDLDADGVRDYVISAPLVSEVAYVYSGQSGSLLLTLGPVNGAGFFGRALADAGDVDGDGLTDVILGDDNGDGTFDSSGRAWVFSGADGSVLHGFEGEGEDDNFGFAVDGLGDLDLDGCSDVIVGAPGWDGDGDEEGKVYVYSGRDGTLLFTHDGRGSMGVAVSAAGDVNADGHPDYLAGDKVGAGSRGAVHLYSGRNGLQLYHWIGPAIGTNFGFEVVGGFDVDGDGRLKVAAGAPLDDANGKDSGTAFLYSLGRFYTDATTPTSRPSPSASAAGSSPATSSTSGFSDH